MVASMEYSRISQQHSRAGLVIVIVMGGMLSVFLMYTILFPPPEYGTMRGMIRFLIALCAALFAMVLGGYVITTGGLKALTIKVAGAIAIFVLLMFVVNPLPCKQSRPILCFNYVDFNLLNACRRYSLSSSVRPKLIVCFTVGGITFASNVSPLILKAIWNL
jgi:hypothetical protein